MNIFRTIGVAMMAALALAEEVPTLVTEGMAPGIRLSRGLNARAVIFESCKLASGQMPSAVSVDYVKPDGGLAPLPVTINDWKADETPTEFALMVDISDDRRAAERVARSLAAASFFAQMVPVKDHVRVYAVGRGCESLVEAAAGDEKSHENVASFLAALSESVMKNRGLNEYFRDFCACSMLSQACREVVREMAAVSTASERRIILFSDGLDETGGEEAATRAAYRRELTEQAAQDGVQILTVGFYSDNRVYREGNAWMKEVAEETGGLSLTLPMKGKPAFSGDLSDEEQVMRAELMRWSRPFRGSLAVSLESLSEPAELRVMLSVENEVMGRIIVPRELVASFMGDGEPEAVPGPEDVAVAPEPPVPDEALVASFRKLLAEAHELKMSVQGVINCAAVDAAWVTPAAHEAIRRRVSALQEQLKALRAVEPAQLLPIRENALAAAGEESLPMVKQLCSMLDAPQPPTDEKLLILCGCPAGGLPPVAEPVNTRLYAALGISVPGLLALGILVRALVRRRRRKKALYELKNAVTGEVFYVTKLRVTIGRARNQDIVVRDSSVSSHHAVIQREAGDEWVLTDCQSTNKIFAYGQVTERLPLRNGTVFELGSVRFVFNSVSEHS